MLVRAQPLGQLAIQKSYQRGKSDWRVRLNAEGKAWLSDKCIKWPSPWRNYGHRWFLSVKHFCSVFLRGFEVYSANAWLSGRKYFQIFVYIFRIMCLTCKSELSNLTVVRFWLRYLGDGGVAWWKHGLRFSLIFSL